MKAIEMAEETEQEEVSQALPETLVEKIIAMMPFPSMFKARALSKSWWDKFSPISPSSNSGAEKSLAAAAFQRQVGERSTNWKTFSPVLLAREDLVAYDRAAQNWPRLRSMLSFLQDCPLCSNSSLLIEGALCYGFPVAKSSTDDREHVVVANILTRSWRLLPPRPNALGSTVLCLKLVVYPSLAMYKVILFCKTGSFCSYHYCAQIYDSKSGAWRSKDFRLSRDFSGEEPRSSAYLNGVLYMVGIVFPGSLLAFNMEEGTLKELRLSFNRDDICAFALNLVICNENSLMMVAKGTWHEGEYHETIQVFRIDLGSLRLLPLVHWPPAALNLGIISRPAGCDGNCLFFNKVEQTGTQVVAYNIDEDVWSSVPWPAYGRSYPWSEYSFRPGLSPFMAV